MLYLYEYYVYSNVTFYIFVYQLYFLYFLFYSFVLV